MFPQMRKKITFYSVGNADVSAMNEAFWSIFYWRHPKDPKKGSPNHMYHNFTFYGHIWQKCEVCVILDFSSESRVHARAHGSAQNSLISASSSRNLQKWRSASRYYCTIFFEVLLKCLEYLFITFIRTPFWFWVLFSQH